MRPFFLSVPRRSKKVCVDNSKKHLTKRFMGGTTLTPGSIYTEHLYQSYGVANGRGYILVVPDDATQGLDIHHLSYAAKTSEPVTAAQYEALNDITKAKDNLMIDPEAYAFVTTKADEDAQVAAMTALSVFPLFFLALALTMTAATILTIQQLSESDHYQRQFELLRKLGMDRREMAAALRTQFAIYYTMPTVPSILIGIPFILNLAKTPEPGVMVGASSPAAIVCIALCIFFLIYAVYILLAYTSLRRNVLPGNR